MWHGSFAALAANLGDTVVRYGKPVVVVETAYPWTLDNGDQLENFITISDQLPDAAVYPATPDGQAEWIPGVGWAPGEGNPNDNLTMFDWDGRALPSVAAFRPPRRP